MEPVVQTPHVATEGDLEGDLGKVEAMVNVTGYFSKKDLCLYVAHITMLREFPLVVAADTSHEGGHRLVGTPGLPLEITHAECCTLAEVRVKDALGEQLKEVQGLEVSN